MSAENKKSSPIKISSKPGKLSPYIIHLSGANHSTEVGASAAPVDHLENLKQSLLLDPELMLDDATDHEHHDLEVDFNDLVAQLRELDAQIGQLSAETETAAQPIISEREISAPSNVHELVEMDIDSQALIEDEVITIAQEIKAEIAVAETEEAPEPINTFTPEELADPSPTSYQQPANFSLFRPLAVFFAISLLLIMPLHAMQGLGAASTVKADISDAGKRAIDNLTRGASALSDNRFELAGANFASAANDFDDAQAALSGLQSTVASLLSLIPQTDRTYDSVRGLITAGGELSQAATLFSQAAGEVSDETSTNVVTKLSILKTYITKAQPHVALATEALNEVDPDVLPSEYSEQVANLKDRTPELNNALSEFITFSDTLKMILGENRKMRYLVAFQNNTELRATGGFVGSFAQIDVLNGEIVDINIPGGGSYDVQGQLAAFVAPPAPLTLVNPRWEFHDANWFPDFPTSASKMMWFYEKSGGPTVDGVIAVNATMLPDLLAILGEVEMPEYNKTINSENFLFETQKIVEVEYKNLNTAPKQFIGDLAPKLLERMKTADMPTMLAVLGRLGTGLQEKDVQFYFDNNALEAQMNQLGWSGQIIETSGDYLMVVDTNLGGGKTDTVIDQNIDVQVDVADDGSITNTVTVTKEHHGLKNALFEGVNNVDYLRLYVPQGSEFLGGSGFEAPPASAYDQTDLKLSFDEDLALQMSNERQDSGTGTDIWDEHGKTVFGNWIQTKPGEIQTITISYRLPWKIVSDDESTGLLAAAKAKLGFKNLQTYSLIVQKQSGVNTRETKVTLNLPGNRRLVWGSQDGDSQANEITIDNRTDAFLRFLIEKLPQE
jgi:hypothetical protein